MTPRIYRATAKRIASRKAILIFLIVFAGMGPWVLDLVRPDGLAVALTLAGYWAVFTVIWFGRDPSELSILGAWFGALFLDVILFYAITYTLRALADVS